MPRLCRLARLGCGYGLSGHDQRRCGFYKAPGIVALVSFLDAQPDERFIVLFDDTKRFACSTKYHIQLRGIACCADCDVPLRSSFARGKLGTRYPCYLCQTKSCVSYGKSIKRDVLENDIGDIIKTLQPDQSVVRLLTGMFRHIWEARGAQAVSAQRQGTVLDREIDKLLDLIMASSNTTVIQKYEEKITQHELDKARLLEKLEKQVEPAGAFEEKLEPAITFLTNP